jgi:hypothetical protein
MSQVLVQRWTPRLWQCAAWLHLSHTLGSADRWICRNGLAISREPPDKLQRFPVALRTLWTTPRPEPGVPRWESAISRRARIFAVETPHFLRDYKLVCKYLEGDHISKRYLSTTEKYPRTIKVNFLHIGRIYKFVKWYINIHLKTKTGWSVGNVVL